MCGRGGGMAELPMGDQVELLPCPFCGKVPEMPETWMDLAYDEDMEVWGISCHPGCGAIGPRVIYQWDCEWDGTSQEVEKFREILRLVAEAWNRRAALQNEGRLREALADMLTACEIMERFRQIVPEEQRRSDIIDQYEAAKKFAKEAITASPAPPPTTERDEYWACCNCHEKVFGSSIELPTAVCKCGVGKGCWKYFKPLNLT